MILKTHTGDVIHAKPGDWMVQEYHQGLLSRVYVYPSYEAAREKKQTLASQETDNSPKHFAIREAK